MSPTIQKTAGIVAFFAFAFFTLFKIYGDQISNEYISKKRIRTVMNTMELLCYNFNRSDSCEVAFYPRNVTDTYVVYDEFSIFEGPQKNVYIKALFSGRAEFKGNALCRDVTGLAFVDETTFFLSKDRSAILSKGDTVIRENDGAADFRELIKRTLRPTLFGNEVCSKYKEHEMRGDKISSYMTVDLIGDEVISESEFHMFGRGNASGLKLTPIQ